MLTVQETAALLKSFDNVLILTHVRPDGDTVGCAAALAVRDGVDITDIPYEEYVRIVDGRGAFAGERDLTMGFDESYAVYLKKMNALGRAPDPRYADFTPASRVYIPVDLPHTDVEKALHTDAPGAGIFATYLGYGNMSADRLAEDMLGDGDRLYRYNCAITLGLLGDKRAVPVLTEIVEKRDAFFFAACRRSNQFRTAVAVCLLGRIGNADTAALLESLLDEAEYENPMYHTLKPDYLYYARNDRNFVYYAVITHTLVALCKTYRREGLPMAALRERVLPFLGGKFRERVSDLVPGSPTTEEIKIMRPYFCSRMISMAAREQSIPLVRLVRIMRSQSSSVISKISRGCDVPALLTRISTLPKVSMIFANSARTSSASLTSARTTRARLPIFSISAATSCAACSLPT